MPDKKIVIAGGTGFIGQYCAEKYRELGYQVIIISRQSGHVNWGDKDGIVAALELSELLLNLAGKSVDCRYSEKNKQAILTSRTSTTTELGAALQQCTAPPPLWINASTATIYRDALDRPMTEDDGEIGSGFSVSVGKAWEDAFYAPSLPDTRRVALRITIVLGHQGGAMVPYMMMTRLGLGGRQGSRKQMFSWIHIDDLFRLVQFVQEHPELEGPINAAAPYPVPNAEFMKTLRKKMHRPVGLPAMAWMLEIGAFVIRTETELLMKSRWVVSKRLQEIGFEFRYPDIDTAVEQIVTAAAH